MPRGVSTGEKVSPARQDALHALLASNYTRDECKKILRIGTDTIKVLRRKRPPHPERVGLIKRGLAAKIWDKADAANDAMTDEKLLAMNAHQLSIIQAINIDKALLLEGKATSIINFQGLSKDIIDVDAEIVELEKQIALRS